MSKEMRKYIDTFKQRLTESENFNISDVMTSLPKIRVHYMTELGGKITILELDELLSFMKRFKVLYLGYIFGNES